MQIEPRENREATGTPPLTLPHDLWVKMSSDQKLACHSAASLLDTFAADTTVLLRDLFTRTKLGADQTLAGLRVLQGMDLVNVEATEEGPIVELVAVPEEHVRIVGPDGHVRWLLVSRPLEAPELDPASLN